MVWLYCASTQKRTPRLFCKMQVHHGMIPAPYGYAPQQQLQQQLQHPGQQTTSLQLQTGPLAQVQYGSAPTRQQQQISTGPVDDPLVPRKQQTSPSGLHLHPPRTRPSNARPPRQSTHPKAATHSLQQTRRAPMGSPASPALCDMVVAVCEPASSRGPHITYRTRTYNVKHTTPHRFTVSGFIATRYVGNRLTLVPTSAKHSTHFQHFLSRHFYGPPISLLSRVRLAVDQPLPTDRKTRCTDEVCTTFVAYTHNTSIGRQSQGINSCGASCLYHKSIIVVRSHLAEQTLCYDASQRHEWKPQPNPHGDEQQQPIPTTAGPQTEAAEIIQISLTVAGR